jgi:hypothetical protein
MSWQSALTSDQLNQLRGTSSVAPSFSGAVYLSLCPNPTVYSARINQTQFASAFAQLTYDGGSGTLADVLPGMTVLLSKTNDPDKAYWAGRVRKAPTSTLLYINESSIGDAANDDYIFVINDYRLWDKLGRETSGVLYVDYDVAFTRMPPVIHNLPSAYAGWINTGTSRLDISFNAAAFTAESGATISSWSWSIADGTLQSGSLTTANPVVRFPAGFRWVSVTVTDSGGRTATRRIPIWAHSTSYLPQLLGAEDLRVSATVEGGYSATVTAFDGVSSVLDNTLVVGWGDDVYQTGAGSFTGNNLLIVGRIRQQTDTIRAVDDAGVQAELRYGIEGPLDQLSRLEQLPYEFTSVTSPTKWGQVVNLTPWRACVLLLHMSSTFLTLHSLSFSSTADTFQYLGFVTEGSNVLAALNDMAGSINAAVQMDAAGQAQIVRDATLLESGDRSALPLVATWGTGDVLDLSLDRDTVETVGRLEADGGSFNATVNGITPVRSLAPGIAQGAGEGSAQLPRQVLAANQSKALAELELNRRAGHAYAKAQPIDRLTVTHPDGYHWLTPALDQWYRFDLGTSLLVGGAALDPLARWLLVAINISHDAPTGTKQVQATYLLETAGAPGTTINYPPSGGGAEFPPEVEYPPFDTGWDLPDDWYQPPGGGGGPVLDPPEGARKDGNTVMAVTGGTDNRLYLTKNYLSATPTWKDITPPGIAVDAELKQAIFDPWRDKGAYLLARQPFNTWCKEWDFTIDDGGWSPMEIGEDLAFSPPWTGGAAVYVAGEGWGRTTSNWGAYWSAGTIGIKKAFSGVVTRVTIELDAFGTIFRRLFWLNGLGNPATPQPPNVSYIPPGTVTDMEYTFPAPIGVGSGFSVGIARNDAAWPSTTRIVRLRLEGIGPNPFGEDDCVSEEPPPELIQDVVWRTDNVFADPAVWAMGAPVAAELTLIDTTPIKNALYAADTLTASSYYSTDRGASWATAEDAGAPNTPMSGADVSKFTSVLLLSGDGQVQRQATGGAFAAYGGAREGGAIFIPRVTFTTLNTLNTSSNPQYLLAAGESDAGESLWRVTVSGATFTAITPTIGSDDGLATGPHCIVMPWRSGRIILAVLAFGAAVKLVRSLDSGSTWVTVGDALDYVRMRTGDTTMKQAYVNTPTGPGYVPNIQATSPTLVVKPFPTTEDIVSIEVYG